MHGPYRDALGTCRTADGPMALPLARRTMAERFRANSWSFLTGVGPKVVQCGCHASCVSSSPALSPRAGAWTITAVWLWLSSCRGAIAVVKRCRNWFEGWGEIK